jgi:type IX secretion system PorP/SprF family membrane protein
VKIIFSKYKLAFLLSALSLISFAQDPQFSQFYSNPVYLNPAFTGLTFQHRIIGNYRNQWLGISKAFSTYAIGYDYNAVEKNMGVGLQVINDAAGTTGLKNTSLASSLCWHGDITRFTEFRGGASISYNMLRMNSDRLIFNDQLYYGTSSSIESENYASKNYLDINAGVLISSVNYWGGISLRHISRPDIDMSNSGGARLPALLSLHGGYRFVVEKSGREVKKFISPVVHYRHQKKFDQLDLGFYYDHNALQLGLWYRGIPVKKYASGYANSDALIILVGFEVEKYSLKIGYSYDLPMSKLISNTSGSHELSVIYEIAKKSRKSKRVLISTPKF